MLKIALIGYGKMGKMVEEIATQRGHIITARIAPTLPTSKITAESIAHADVCIDFSHPNCALEHIKQLAMLGKNIVMGTTGWYEHLDDIRPLIQQSQIGFLYASNFSIGIHLFMKIVAEAASAIDAFDDYDISLLEAHHQHKADSPSGTALSIAHLLLDKISRKNTLTMNLTGKIAPNELQVTSLRCGAIPGTHSVILDSAADTITLTHQARNRDGFAKGTVIAAEWLNGKQGFYTIEDMLNRS